MVQGTDPVMNRLSETELKRNFISAVLGACVGSLAVIAYVLPTLINDIQDDAILKAAYEKMDYKNVEISAPTVEGEAICRYHVARQVKASTRYGEPIHDIACALQTSDGKDWKVYFFPQP